MPSEPLWLQEARKWIGTAEIVGPTHSPAIIGWLRKLGAWWQEDETAWCGVFTAHCMDAAGFAIPKMWMRARAWAEWGVKLPMPTTGCVVVFERKGGGHVGFVVGQTQSGDLMVLGGNQGNKVSIAPFARDRVIGYYWPSASDVPALAHLAILDAAGQQRSTNES